MITIERESAYADKIRNYKVILDNEVIGEIGDGQTYSFNAKEGTHTLFLKLDWARSNKMTFESVGDETIHFKCVSSLKGSAVLLTIVYATFLFWRYIKLERVD